MNWEWRAFYDDPDYRPWNQNQKGLETLQQLLKDAKLDKRPDYYLNASDRECGFKERWSSDGLKIELKVLQQEKAEQVNGNSIGNLELWDKCMSRKIDAESIDETIGITSTELLDSLQAEKQSGQKDKSAKSTQKISSLTESLKDGADYSRVKIEKERKQCRALHSPDTGKWEFKLEKIDDPNGIIIEQTDLVIREGTTGDPIPYSSVCIEGENPEVIRQFLEEFVLMDKGAIMSYPEFIMNVSNKN